MRAMFYKNSTKASGLCCWCKLCQRSYGAAWRAKPEVRARIAAIVHPPDVLLRQRASFFRAGCKKRSAQQGRDPEPRATVAELADLLESFLRKQGVRPCDYADVLPLIEFDHIVPMAAGGANTIDNVRAILASDHVGKWDMSAADHRLARCRSLLALYSGDWQQLASDLGACATRKGGVW